VVLAECSKSEPPYERGALDEDHRGTASHAGSAHLSVLAYQGLGYWLPEDDYFGHSHATHSTLLRKASCCDRLSSPFIRVSRLCPSRGRGWKWCAREKQ